MKLSPGNGVRGLLPDGDRAEDRINVFKTKRRKHYETQKVMALTMAGAMAQHLPLAEAVLPQQRQQRQLRQQQPQQQITAAAADNGSSDAETVLQVAFENSISEPVGQGWEKAQEIIKEKSGGKMAIEIYPDSQLGDKSS